MDDWKTRYWGSNYDKLLSIKNKYDPDAVFQCYHCIGYESPTSFSYGNYKLTLLKMLLIAGGLGLALTV